VICFHFSIFALMETAEYSESFNIQALTITARIKNQDVSKHKIPLVKRDFMFKTIQAVGQEY